MTSSATASLAPEKISLEEAIKSRRSVRGYLETILMKEADLAADKRNDYIKSVLTTTTHLDKLVDQNRLGLKNQSGFYKYEGDAAETLKRERDRKLYARRRIFMDENK